MDPSRGRTVGSVSALQALGKLSRVQAAYATLEERLKIQEEAGMGSVYSRIFFVFCGIL